MGLNKHGRIVSSSLGGISVEMGITGKFAVVTGGGAGIGQAIALALAQEGAHISILDVNLESASETAYQIRQLGRKAFICQADVSDPSAVNRAGNEILQHFGRIDILINNAGISHPAESILDLDLQHLEKVIGVNLNGLYFCCRRFGEEMVRQGSGVLINIASIAGITSLPLPVYGPTKSAVIMLTQILAKDWAKKGVRVNAIAPGYVLTPLLQRMIDEGLRDPDHLLGCIPMGTFIRPSDIANVAIFLCSEKARYITGITLPVDGGFLSSCGWRAYGYD
jgi:NAD(P)-dependent dehydrogenase (short-subunit alcohol dehydrogenase family)